MSKKKFTKLDVQTGVRETGIRASLPSAPTPTQYGGGGGYGSRFGGRGGGGGDRGRRDDRYESSAADSSDNWRRGGAAPPPVRRDRDREMPRRSNRDGDGGGFGSSRRSGDSGGGFGGGFGSRDRDRDRDRDRGSFGGNFARNDDEGGNWRSADRKQPQRTTRVSLSSSGPSRGWGDGPSSRGGGGGSRFGESRQQPRSRPAPSGSKFSGSNKGFGKRRSNLSDSAPPEPRITYSSPRTAKLGRFSNSRTGVSASSTQAQDEFPTLPKTKAPEPPKPTATTASKVAGASTTQAASAKRQPTKAAKPKPKPKLTAEQKRKNLQRSFQKKIKKGSEVSLNELREGIKIQRKVSDQLVDSITASVTSSSNVTLGDLASALENVEIASMLFSRVLGELYNKMSASEMTAVLDESKIDFEGFVPEDEDLSGFYGDLMELVCYNETVNTRVENAQSPQEIVAITLESDPSDFSLSSCRNVGMELCKLLFGGEVVQRGNELANAFSKICAGDMKKFILIGCVVETWLAGGKSASLDVHLQQLLDGSVLTFADVKDWQTDERDKGAAKRDALFALTDWMFQMDHTLYRAREEAEENEEDGSDEEDVGADDYAGNLFQKAKHKTYSDIIYYDT